MQAKAIWAVPIWGETLCGFARGRTNLGAGGMAKIWGGGNCPLPLPHAGYGPVIHKKENSSLLQCLNAYKYR